MNENYEGHEYMCPVCRESFIATESTKEHS